MLLAPGALFDRYRIGELLGEGGMGRVHRAFDERLQRWIALKILHAGDGARPSDSRASTDGAARLLREARAAAALDHPNAVAIFDVGEVRATPDAPAVPYIAMELIEGRNLRTFIGATGAPVSIAERARWLADVARALSAAHERGLVHRDIKPENVMIRRDGVVKVLDFGIARRSPAGLVDVNAPTQGAAFAGTLTADGVVVGTPFYMAPEQMRGEPLDGRADQFSWGVVAYELLSGTLPWEREGDALRIVSEVLSKEPAPLRAVAPDVPPALEATIARAMKKAQGDRFASMDEIVRSLDVQAPHSVPRPLPALVDSAALGSAPTVQSTRTSLASPRSRAPTAAPRVTRRWWAWLAAGAGVAVALAVGARLRSRTHAVTEPTSVASTPTAVTDLPLPTTTPEALAAYREGLRAVRLGDRSVSARSFRRAVELDPQLAVALLRLAVMVLNEEPAAARDYFTRALRLRGTLTERDRGFLDAFAPYVQDEPSDVPEARKRLLALSERYPMDAEIAFDLGAMDVQLRAIDLAVVELRRAAQLDPEFALPLIDESYLLGMERGDFEGAIAATKECERIAPGETRCFMARDEIDAQEGRCAELEGDARKMIVRNPSSDLGYLFSAQALFMLGSPMQSVREAITQAQARMDDAQKSWLGMALTEFDLEIIEGRFDKADALLRAREAQRSVRDSTEENVHGADAWARVELATELGRPADAVAVAADFRDRSAAWTRPASQSPELINFDFRVPLLSVLAHGGRITPRQLEDARTEWLERWNPVVASRGGAYLWIGAFARGATTPEDARRALEALPRYLPLPAFWQFPTDLAIGKVYLLAGRVDEALPYLKRATVACNALDVPFDHVRAHLYLGQALEAKGDAAGACAAYAGVQKRWGAAKPRSVTADAAAARARALRCPP